MAISTNR